MQTHRTSRNQFQSPFLCAHVARRPRHLALLLGQLGLLTVLALGSGCRATSHVVKLSQPHVQLTAHHVEKIEAAYVGDDGRLVLQARGKLAGGSKPATLTLALPAPPEAGHSGRERVIVPSASLQAGWQSESALRSVPIGSPLVFERYGSYQWARLRPDAGRCEEIRLVRRNGEEQRWELLYSQRVEATGECRFTVFEVQSAQTVVRNSAAFALVPFAAALDTVAVGTAATGKSVITSSIVLSGVAQTAVTLVFAPAASSEVLPEVFNNTVQAIEELNQPVK